MLIYHQKLSELTGFDSYGKFRMAHQELVYDSLVNGNNSRQPQWTESIAVGSKCFLEGIKINWVSWRKGEESLKIMEIFSYGKIWEPIMPFLIAKKRI